MAIIGVLGFIGSGKGAVSDILVSDYGFRKDSFATSLKDGCAVMFDWPRDLLEGDTDESREWREQVDEWWGDRLGIEHFTPRLALQYIGTEVLRTHFHNDFWLLTLQNRYHKLQNKNVVIPDVRFPNEIKMLRNIGGELIWVKRGKTPVWFDVAVLANRGDEDAYRDMRESFPHAHHSEWAWVGAPVNHVISNDGSLDDLKDRLRQIIT